MWRNYLTVGIRSLTKNRAYALINILGLAIGMAACVLILLFVRNELSFDRDLPGSENVYQLQTYYTDPDNGERMDMQMAAYVTQKAMQKDFPQIADTVYAMGTSPVVLHNGQATELPDARYVDGKFFDMFPFPFVRGDGATALTNVGSVALSETAAHRYFGNADPIGRTLTLVSAGKAHDFRVTGVYRDLPRNSHMILPLVARIDFATFFSDRPAFLTQWGWQSGWMYFRLKPGTDVAAINAQMKAWEKRNIPDDNFGTQRFNQGDFTDFALVNIRDIHLGFAQAGAQTPGNDYRSITTFAVVAALILGMACVNFTNLATARASQRAREVALRKVLGASRRQLIVQFLGESVLVAALAMLLALAFVEIVLPSLSAFLKADLDLHYFGRDGVLPPVLLLVLLVGVAGGLYPAFFLSRFQPAQVLKANKSTAETGGSGRLRGALVVGQFAVSIGLIICTLVVYAQTIHARTSDPGYRRDGLIQIENLGRRQLYPVTQALTEQIARVPGVVSVGRTTIGVNTQNNTNVGVLLPGRADPLTIGNYAVDENFFGTMDIRLVAGRLFDRARPADDATTPFPEVPAAERALVARGINVVVNELAVRRLGYSDPQAAIGKRFNVGYDENYGGVLPATIIGVVRNSRFRSVREPVPPIMFRMTTNYHDAMVVRYDGDPAAVRDRIDAVWKRLAPEVPFDGRFTDDIIRDLYHAEAARAQTFAAFALLAVIVGCLGLFGLASFTAERRTKEIGIRKVLGARTQDIVRLLVWQFSRPVLIANLIAWPIAWWVMRDWLNNFDARVTLGPWPFLLAGSLALVIAVVTIGAHALKVARANPIHALRYE